MLAQRFERYELKYFVTPAEAERVKAMVAPLMRRDDFASGRAGGEYTVRSIYFDTPGLRFYHEKDAGARKRKKLRIRSYNARGPDSVASIEIKRKYGNIIVKERVLLPLEEGLWFIERRSLEAVGVNLSVPSRQTLERFLFLLEALSLVPTVLVAYEREPFVALENERVRLTVDKHVRSRIRPQLDELFTEHNMRYVTGSRYILEIKFDGAMPAWLRPVTRMLDRSHRAISKYCRGIDAWADHVLL